MKTIQDWFNEYGESHQNKTNKIIHWICIPLIFWSIIALLSLVPDTMLNVFNNSFINDLIHWGTFIIFLGLLFYLRLSMSIFLGMLVFSTLVLLDVYLIVYLFDSHKYWGLFNSLEIEGNLFLLILSIIVFIGSWILQFIGHKIEGKKPSFVKDIQFLLIGPAWLLGYIYKKIGIKF